MSDTAGAVPVVSDLDGAGATAPPRRPAGDAPLRRLAADFARSRLAVASLALLALIIAGALLAPLVAPQDPYDLEQIDIMDSLLPPDSPATAGGFYLLGTDAQGRDMLSAILYGLRISLLVSVASTVLAFAVGVPLGVGAGYVGGCSDAVLMRLADIQLGFPAVLVALVLLAVLGHGVDKVVLALTLVQWAHYARTVRASALVERQKAYVEAARGLALGRGRVLFRHVLPNCLAPVIVVGAVQVAHAVTLEATLSFLGVGVPVTAPSLGQLVANGSDFMLSGEYWIGFFPGLSLLLAVASTNLVADRLRQVLSPHLEQ